MSLLGGPERSECTGFALPVHAAAVLAATLLAGCSSGPLSIAGYPMLDDGLCGGGLGLAREVWSGPAIGAANDGERTFFVDGKDGHLRVASGDAAPSLVATKLVEAPERIAWGWLAVDRSHVYWAPGHIHSQRGGERHLVRVSKPGGPVQHGFRPRAPIIAVHIDDRGGLLLTEEGLWTLDLRDWGKARLLREGQFASMVADQARAYLRPVRDAAPMDFVAHQVLGENGCHEPTGGTIVAVDRQSGAETRVFESGELSLFGPLVVDEAHLFVAATPTALLADPKTCKVRRLLRISKESGAVQARETPVGIGGDLTQVGGRLYWIDAGSGRVFSTPKAGGRVAVIAQQSCRPNRLLASGHRIHVWKADGGQCALAALATNHEVSSAAANLEAGDALLTVGGDWAYVADFDDQLRRISLSRGTTELIRRKDGAPVTASQAAVMGEALFFVTPEFLGRWSAAAKEVTQVYEGRPRAMAAEGDELYVATDDGTIAALGKSGRARTVALGTGSSVRDLAALRRAAYWIEGPPPSRPGGRALWTSGPDGLRTQLAAADGINLIASDGSAIYYATEGRSRILPSDRELSGTIVRFADEKATPIAERQEAVTDLRASPRGVFWRQRRGVRMLDQTGKLQALDCTLADQGVGLSESGGVVYWADGTARALMMVRLPARR